MATINENIWGPLRTDANWQTVLGEDVHYTQTVETTLSTGNNKHEPLDNSVCIFGFGSTSPAVNAQVITCDFNTDTKTTRNLYPNRTSVPWAMAWTDGPSYDASEWQSGYANSYWGNNYRWLTASPQGMWEEEYLGDRAKPLYFLSNDFDYQRKWLVLVKPIVLTPKTVQEGGDTVEYKRGRAYGGFTTLKNWYDNVKDVYDGICQIIMAPTTFSNDIPTNSGGLNFSLFAEIEDEINVEYQEGHPKYNQQKIDGQFYAYKTYIGPYTTFDGSNYLNGYMTIAGGYNVRNDGDWNRTPWTVLYIPTVGDWDTYMINSTSDQDDYGWGFFAAYNPGTKSYNQVEDEIAKVAAHMGTFFIFDMADKNKDNDDINVFLGLLDENAISTGEYSRGEANRDSDQFDWDKAGDADYDPNYNPDVPEPGDDPAASDNPLLPVGLTWTLANTGTGIWALTPSEIGQVWKDIFGTTADLSKFGDQPMNAILSLKWTPFTWSTNGTSPIVLGDQIVNDIHVYPLVDSVGEAEQHGWGQMKFNFNKNFYNARNIQARLFLPFYGYYELPAAQLLSSRLRVDFYYNIPDDLGVWVISYDNVIYDFVECSCDMDIPLTGSNAAAIRENKKSEALTIATQVASTLVTLGNTSLSNLAGSATVNAIDRYGGVGSIMSSAQGSLGSKLSTAAAYGAGKLASTALPYAGVGITGAVNVYNTVHQAQIQRAALRTNLPYHGSALQTTFLHMSMVPYVQIFKNTIMSGLETANGGTVRVELGGSSETEYKLKVGHACDMFATINGMPENSLLQTTGMANNSTAGMELSEVNELNTILQSGFLR